ncbi:MarR family transcriptional regulator [Streptococcus chenjunshii]|uniref:MarR family transcriptional regulator n=1 Tax=Streptococcus chenjunshii TaxID=2173853 RepID=A0A372KKW8_9STRE|nr:MarR family transcriptional regulator [Streptococcus chenjunshii]AXQ79186.1 MarR family transcriptional regulator [Streptococcus chenjunshii]RFU50758.1 MarR family transcriptional regulator [Streptococcus chenjunshii]RFU52939.1 MarR family transcriptional regulator [Streptococcus chenjunshii]
MDKEKSKKIQEISKIFTGLSFAKNQALILAFLVTEKKNSVTFSRILKELKLSKASASIALRSLAEKELISYRRSQNSRERQITPHLYGTVAYISHRMQILKEMRGLFEQAALWHQDDRNYAQEFLTIADLYKQLDHAVMNIIETFEGGNNESRQ